MLLDQTILIIGGSAGIGRAVAEAAADAGAHVIIAARDRARVAETISAIGGDARGELVDLRDETSLRDLLKRVGSVDHVVATPGFDHAASPVVETNAKIVDDLWRTKFLGQYLVAKHAGPHLSERGSLVLTSGFLAVRPAAGFAALSAVNAAVDALAQALALEWAPRRVNVISPGVVDTGKRFAALPPAEREARLQSAIADQLPVRHVGAPAELAQAYLFAMQNTFLTGRSLVVDGGGALV